MQNAHLLALPRRCSVTHIVNLIFTAFSVFEVLIASTWLRWEYSFGSGTRWIRPISPTKYIVRRMMTNEVGRDKIIDALTALYIQKFLRWFFAHLLQWFWHSLRRNHEKCFICGHQFWERFLKKKFRRSLSSFRVRNLFGKKENFENP